MSVPGDEMDALLDAVRDELIARLDLKPGECDVTPDGQPNPNSGKVFLAVHGGAVQNSQMHALDELYSFTVTVTVQTAANPRDRKRDGGAWKLALRARAALHMNETVRSRAWGASGVQPPVFAGATFLGPKDPTWFWAEPTGTSRDPTGIAIELRFERARRTVYIGEDET